MFEVNTILFLLLLEGFVLLAMVLALVCVIALRRNARRKRAVGQLIDRLQERFDARFEETGPFLQASYQLEGEELREAVLAIDREERQFFQQLIDVVETNDFEQLATLDAALVALIDTYKCMKPRALESDDDSETALEMAELRETGDRLRKELSITKETMGSMIAEFGNMFGGGKDHELARHEVVERLIEAEGEGRSIGETVRELLPDEEAAAAPAEDAGRELSPDDEDAIPLSAQK